MQVAIRHIQTLRPSIKDKKRIRYKIGRKEDRQYS